MPTDIEITLREITAETLSHILKLKVTDNQNQFVAPNAVSISQAHFAEHAWFRGIYAKLGFVETGKMIEGEHIMLLRF